MQAWNSQSAPYISLWINDANVQTIVAGSSSEGTKKGYVYTTHLNIGDTIYLRNPENKGWGFGRIKIYELTNSDIIDLNE